MTSELVSRFRPLRSFWRVARSNMKAALVVLTAGERVAATEPPQSESDTSAPHDLGSVARELYETGQYTRAEYFLWEVLRTSPRAPATTYLLGLSMLFQGKYAEGRRMIDRAYELRHWLDDRVCSPQVFEMLDAVEAAFPDWDWPRYQRMREQWRATGLDLVAAVSELASSTDERVAFVQIGANDGRSGDPLRRLIEGHQMAGVFVEPQAIPFERLKERYDGVPNLRFAQVAIAETDGPVTLYTDPSRTTLGTLDPDRNIMRNRLATAVEETVEGRSFESLADDMSVDQFDVLQLDTEGFDYKILRQIPLDEHGVRVVNMEYFCLPVSERLAASVLLEQLGFALFFSDMDLLAVRLEQFEDRFCITRIGG